MGTKNIEPEKTDIPMIGDTIAKSKAAIKRAQEKKETKTEANSELSADELLLPGEEKLTSEEVERLTGDQDHLENEQQNSQLDKTVNTEVKEEMEKRKTGNEVRHEKESQEMFNIIDWYRINCEIIGAEHLEQLMQKRAKLASYSVTYARFVLRYAKEYAKNHVTRQINVKVRANELQAMRDPNAAGDKTYTNARANEIATAENKAVYMAEYMAEADYNGHRIILNQINAVLDSMRQDIAELRGIRGDSDKTAGDNR